MRLQKYEIYFILDLVFIIFGTLLQILKIYVDRSILITKMFKTPL